jgi:hypothetical protein
MIPDPSHYLICLALGILVNHLLARKMLSQKEQGKEKYLIALLMLLAFFVSLHWNFLGFILTAAFSTALMAAISIPIYAVAVTLILYVCRPWEVVEANEWWLQIPRWCIWIWLLSWFRKMAEIGSHSLWAFGPASQLLSLGIRQQAFSITLIPSSEHFFSSLSSG